jgi:GTP-binding protein
VTIIVALNKIDALDEASLDALVQAFETELNHPIHCISAVSGVGVQPLLQQVWLALDL